jgi:hypothetical protein
MGVIKEQIEKLQNSVQVLLDQIAEVQKSCPHTEKENGLTYPCFPALICQECGEAFPPKVDPD